MEEPGEPLLLTQRRSARALAIFDEEGTALLDALLKEPAQAARLLHSLKGGCAAIGAPRLMGACATLERRAKAGEWLDLEREVARLREVFVATRTAMHAEHSNG